MSKKKTPKEERLSLLDALQYTSLSAYQDGPIPKYDARSYEEAFGELGPAMRALHAGHLILDLLNGKDDRTAAIIGQSFIEELVRRLVEKALLSGKESRQLLSTDGPLGAFVQRVKMAVALGLIDSAFSDHLRQLAIIRNAFAHNFEIDTFDEIGEECAKLAKFHVLSDKSDTPRQQFHLALFLANHKLAKALHRATPREYVGDGPIVVQNAGIE